MTPTEQLEKTIAKMERLIEKGQNDEKVNDRYRALIKEVNGW